MSSHLRKRGDVQTQAVAFGIAFVVLQMLFIWVTYRSPAYRNDMRPGGQPLHGRHKIGQLNVLDPRHYPASSAGFYRVLIGVLILNILCAVGFVWSVGQLL